MLCVSLSMREPDGQGCIERKLRFYDSILSKCIFWLGIFAYLMVAAYGSQGLWFDFLKSASQLLEISWLHQILTSQVSDFSSQTEWNSKLEKYFDTQTCG